MAENDNRVVTVALLESEWLTAIDALSDRAEQTHELAGEVGDADLVTAAAEDYDRVGRDIESQVRGGGVPTLERMNGFVVVADKPDGDGNRFILGVAHRTHGFEYVVARCHVASKRPTGWFSGHYSESLATALAVFEGSH